jgi:hypothetical protein
MTTNLDLRDRKEYCYSGEWTTTPPTVEGYYWASPSLRGAEVGIVSVVEDMGTLEIHGDEWNNPLSAVTWWLGPLPVPASPQEGK